MIEGRHEPIKALVESIMATITQADPELAESLDLARLQAFVLAHSTRQAYGVKPKGVFVH